MSANTNNMVVTFLGTTSGGGPTETRNCSSLVLDAIGDGSLWMVDCAEGTVRQFAQQPPSSAPRLKMSSINRIFITHMHADHSMGLITLLRNILGFAPDLPAPSTTVGSLSNHGRPPKPPILKVEIYGPVGLRAFVRTILKLTHTRSADRYCVNELLMLGEKASVSGDDQEDWHSSEVKGRDIHCDADGFWRAFVVQERRRSAPISISAGPIVHRDPCIGYIFSEQPELPEEVDETSVAAIPNEMSLLPMPTAPATTPRTVVILGDTSDPSALIPLIKETTQQAVSLLVHEATDAYMPPHIDSRGTTGKNRTHEIVRTKAISKGHSTPAMAGAFARQIGAERLVLNHIGSRFPAPPYNAGPSNFRFACMREMENQATQEWRPTNGGRAVAVSDFDRIVIGPVFNPNMDRLNVDAQGAFAMSTASTLSMTVSQQETVTTTQYVSAQSHGFGRGRGRGGHGQHEHRGSFQSRGGHYHKSVAGEGSSNKKRDHSGGNNRWSEGGSRGHGAHSSASANSTKKPRRGDEP